MGFGPVWGSRPPRSLAGPPVFPLIESTAYSSVHMQTVKFVRLFVYQLTKQHVLLSVTTPVSQSIRSRSTIDMYTRTINASTRSFVQTSGCRTADPIVRPSVGRLGCPSRVDCRPANPSIRSPASHPTNPFVPPHVRRQPARLPTRLPVYCLPAGLHRRLPSIAHQPAYTHVCLSIAHPPAFMPVDALCHPPDLSLNDNAPTHLYTRMISRSHAYLITRPLASPPVQPADKCKNI